MASPSSSSSSSSSAAPIVLILGSGPNIGSAVAGRFRGRGYRVAVVSRGGPGAPAPALTPEGYLHIRADLADAGAYAGVYAAVREAFGEHGDGGGKGRGQGRGGSSGSSGIPDVVVFNAASLTPPADPDRDLFGVPLDGFQRDLDLMVKGAFVAAGEAYRLWNNDDDDDDDDDDDNDDSGSGGSGSGSGTAGEGKTTTESGEKKKKNKKRQFIYTGNKLARVILPWPQVVTLGIAKNASTYWIGLADKLYKEKGFR